MEKGIDKANGQILVQIAKLYDQYQQRSAAMSEDKRQRMGAQIDKKEKQTMESITRLEPKIANLLTDMEKSAAMKKSQLKEYPRLVRECFQDIQTIIRKKNLLFKVNESLEQLINNTSQQAEIIKKDLGVAGETKFLCCGTDGIAKFKSIMEKFRLSHAQWELLAKLEPKDSVETFISPKFSANDYTFIKQILKKLWPQQTVKVEVKEIVKQVNTGKPSRLIQANEYIYGINKQQNPSYGLKIYHEQAENNDSAAASYLGQVYEQGVLLPKDLRKSAKYYQKAMNGKEPYAFYRYAMALIKGELRDKGINRQDIQTGHKLLNQAAFADNPSPQALIELGSLYEKGSFEPDKQGYYKVPIDIKKAIDCYMRARSMNVPRASNNLGVLYMNNKSADSNPNSKINSEDAAHSSLEKGMKYLEQAERLGFPQAFYNVGYVYQNGILGRKNLQQALMSYYKGGLKGDIQSRLKFAYQLMNQTSIMKQQYEDHYRIAQRWLDNIVHKIDILEENSPANSQIGIVHTNSQKAEALFYLGLMHEYGFGAEKSPKTAFKLYSQSSCLGYSPAKNKVGDCYFSGFGVKQDRKLAIGCYLDAAELQNSDAMVNLGTIHLNGIPGIVERNYNQAYTYFLDAIKLENSNAMIHLSFMYKNGLGLESQREMARKLLQDSAAIKNPTALYMLKEMGGEIDEKVLFNNLDNEIFATPRRINLKQIVPYLEDVK